ncbi:MAG: hybrid sensor histidine kinase/response regulator [Myxococcota bacterium]
MSESDVPEMSVGLESSSTLLDPTASDSVFAISKAIFALSESLLSASVEAIPAAVLDGLERLRLRMNADRVWIAEYDGDGSPRPKYESMGSGLESLSSVADSIHADDFRTLRENLRAGRPQYFGPGEEINADTDAGRELARDTNADALALIPLVHEDELRALFGVQIVDAQDSLAPEVCTLLEGAAGVFLQAIVLREVKSALDESQRRYRHLVDTIGQVIFEVDEDGRWTFLSKFWSDISGSAPEEKLGQPMLDSFDDYDGTVLEDCLQGDFTAESIAECDVRLVERVDDPQWVRLTMRPIWGAGGEFEGLRGSLRDASQSRQSVADLQQVDRLVNFGTLAAGIGHELNNPLAFVLGNMDFTAGTLKSLQRELEAASRRHPDDRGLSSCLELVDELGDATRDMKEGAGRLRDIVADLRVFTRVDADGENCAIDLREPLESAISIGFSEIRHRATLIREFSGRLPAVNVHRGRISQVFLNLLVNAAQAFGDNTDQDNRIWVRLRNVDGYVIAEVEDNGPGITDEQKSRIFEAFYTTKPATEGTGLGLSICESLVEEEGGEIEVESQPGEGALFRVRLPAVEGEEPQTRDLSPSPAAGLPRLRVLVVDDEPAVSRTIQRMLGPKHELTTVSDARIAVEALRSGEAFDVILCDIIMPRMNGEEFLGVLSEDFEDLVERIIFMTGGASMDIVTRMRESSPQPILDKPFTRRELRDACFALIRERARADLE